jgi:hypothetical protein
VSVSTKEQTDSETLLLRPSLELQSQMKLSCELRATPNTPSRFPTAPEPDRLQPAQGGADSRAVVKVLGPAKPTTMPRFLHLVVAAMLFALGGCASTTTVHLNPAPQEPICGRSTTAFVLWSTQWRADQKDIPAREAAAAEGLNTFFENSGCFKSASIRRLHETSTATLDAAIAEATTRREKVVLIVIRELGPTVRIGSSLALVEGGTEVVLEISEYGAPGTVPKRFVVEWRNGGHGVVKGVASLPEDLQAALAAGLQPAAR